MLRKLTIYNKKGAFFTVSLSIFLSITTHFQSESPEKGLDLWVKKYVLNNMQHFTQPANK